MVVKKNTLLLKFSFDVDEPKNLLFNIPMTTPHQNDCELIKRYGGPSKLAALLGYAKHNGPQRVSNWRTRGIPPRVKLEHPDIFLADRKAA